jgi:hypothetical protein
MTADAPAPPESLRRRGITGATHDKPAEARVEVPASLIWAHFEPELRARFLRTAEPEAEEGEG